MSQHHDTKKLRIWQQNLNKCQDAHDDFLGSVDPDLYDIVALQEPYLDFRDLTRGTHRWQAVFPATTLRDNAPKMRSTIFISTTLHTSQWEPIKMDCVDVTGVRIFAHEMTVSLYNIYNDGLHHHIPSISYKDI